MISRYTPDHITDIEPGGVYVFGSNTQGHHGKGAAKIAFDYFEAKKGQARGLQGRSYAIVTKDLKKGERSIPLASIKREVLELYRFATECRDLTFYVVKLGCSLAGYTEREMADLFISCDSARPSNVVLPKEFHANGI